MVIIKIGIQGGVIRMDKICSIMQPTYLPWSGYFNLIDRASNFIFLDDAQFSKNSWHNRNTILSSGEKNWISVPVGKDLVAINTKQPNYYSKWNVKHVKILQANYGRHPHFNDLDIILNYLGGLTNESLSEVNMSLIELISDKLGLSCNFVKNSSLNIKGSRTGRLVEICKKFYATTYLSPAGAKEYITNDGDFLKSDIDVEFQIFTPSKYVQKGSKEFISHLSIVDVIANIGWDNSLEYIRNRQ